MRRPAEHLSTSTSLALQRLHEEGAITLYHGSDASVQRILVFDGSTSKCTRVYRGQVVPDGDQRAAAAAAGGIP